MRPPRSDIGRYRKSNAEYRGQYRRRFGVNEHRVLVEQRIGMRLPSTAHVHHVDPTDKLTNKGLFVVCEDGSYHHLLEIRGRALRECGNVNWRKCYRCGKWDDPKNLIINERKRCKGVRPDREGHMDVVHQERDGACVDLDEPRPVNAGVCAESPSGRHNAGTRYVHRNRFKLSGLETKCVDCGATIRRAHEKATRWYSVFRQEKETR